MKVIPKYGDFWCKCVCVAYYALLYYISRCMFIWLTKCKLLYLNIYKI